MFSPKVKIILANVFGSGGSSGSSLTILKVDVSSAVILNFSAGSDVLFQSIGTINSVKTWSLSNASSALRFCFTFSLASNYPQTMPDNFKLTNAEFSGGIWNPLFAGNYYAVGYNDGTNWAVTITQYI